MRDLSDWEQYEHGKSKNSARKNTAATSSIEYSNKIQRERLLSERETLTITRWNFIGTSYQHTLLHIYILRPFLPEQFWLLPSCATSVCDLSKARSSLAIELEDLFSRTVLAFANVLYKCCMWSIKSAILPGNRVGRPICQNSFGFCQCTI